MRINITSLFVDDQRQALRFYTETLGFQKKREVPAGEFLWVTLVSPEEPDGVELSLEPDNHPAVNPFRKAMVEDGIPWTSFAVTDVHAEHERLIAAGVRFLQPPVDHGPVLTAVFDDTCGNLIQIAQEKDLNHDRLDASVPFSRFLRWRSSACPPATPRRPRVKPRSASETFQESDGGSHARPLS